VGAQLAKQARSYSSDSSSIAFNEKAHRVVSQLLNSSNASPATISIVDSWKRAAHFVAPNYGPYKNGRSVKLNDCQKQALPKVGLTVEELQIFVTDENLLKPEMKDFLEKNVKLENGKVALNEEVETPKLSPNPFHRS